MSTSTGGGERRRREPREGLRRFGRLLIGEPRYRENRYRDVLLIIAFALMAWALAVAYEATLTATHATATAKRATATATRATREADVALARVQRGRQLNSAITCAGLSAIGEAGREAIAGGQVGEGPFARFLEAHGYPPFSVRRAQGRAAARAYVGSISAHIDRELRQRGKPPIPGLVRADGTLNCRVFSAVSAASVR